MAQFPILMMANYSGPTIYIYLVYLCVGCMGRMNRTESWFKS